MSNPDISFQDENSQLVTIFSIGHSNQSLETFFALLRQHEIQVLVDVRSSPYSKYVPHFNSNALVAAAEQTDITYMFMGQELGGRPDGNEFYDISGRVLYKRVAESAHFLRGIQRLKEVGCISRSVLMCSEEDPATCHRHLLIGHVLIKQGVDLLHIRSEGHIQNEKELISREEKPFYAQSLWGEQLSDKEEDTWKSIRRVSRKKELPNSLDL